MRGQQSACAICGCPGQVFGLPSYADVCRDKDACRLRAVANERRKNAALERRIKVLEAAAAANTPAAD